jgi:hypothetical protein
MHQAQSGAGGTVDSLVKLIIDGVTPVILVCGEALIDLTPGSTETELACFARPGGSSFNVAIGLGRLGVIREIQVDTLAKAWSSPTGSGRSRAPARVPNLRRDSSRLPSEVGLGWGFACARGARSNELLGEPANHSAGFAVRLVATRWQDCGAMIAG